MGGVAGREINDWFLSRMNVPVSCLGGSWFPFPSVGWALERTKLAKSKQRRRNADMVLLFNRENRRLVTG